MAIAALTDRRAVAAAATLFVLLGSGIVSATIEALGGSDNVLVLGLTAGPLELVRRIYGVAGATPSVPTWALAVSFAAWTVGASAIAIVRYRRLQVTR
jgi:hypothetical protein